VFKRAEPLMSRRRQQTAFWNPDGMLDLFGVASGGTLGKSKAEQERPYLAAWSGKDRGYKAGWLKARGAGRESERSTVPMKACKITRWREGALL
jgi:hypothetical protein